MAVLWCGGEDIDFLNGPILYASTAAGNRRTSAPIGSRCALTMSNLYQWGTLTKSAAFPGGAVSSFWLSFHSKYTGNGASSDRPGNIGVGQIGSEKSILLGTKAGSGNFVIGYDDGLTGVWVTLATMLHDVYVYPSAFRYDVQFVDLGATAVVRLYVDQSATPSWEDTLNLSLAGMASVDCVVVKGGSYQGHFSEVIVANEDTRGMFLVTHYPNAAGDLEEWTGTYTDVDEVLNDNNDLIYTNVAGNDQRINLSPTPVGTYGVKAVMVSAKAGRSVDSTPTKLQMGVFTNASTDVDAAADPGNGIWQNRCRLMPLNPITGVAWTTAELDVLQAVLKSAT